jgi:hypothetical protein
MLYLVAFATAGMLAYMMWLAAFRMRRDRLASQREQSRGRHVFRRPKERVRFLLNRSFKVPEERPEWEENLVSRLPPVPREGVGIEGKGRPS